MSRISIRMLINQHVLMFFEKKPQHPGQIGSIDPHTDVKAVLEGNNYNHLTVILKILKTKMIQHLDAYQNAKFLCDQYYLCSPDATFECINKVDKNDKNIELVYVPSHLYHIAFELYKNAMRAIIECHGEAAKTYPNIQTLIVKGKEDLSIRITDFGGGIPHAKLPQVFKYMYSTAQSPAISADVYDTTSTQAPLVNISFIKHLNYSILINII